MPSTLQLTHHTETGRDSAHSADTEHPRSLRIVLRMYSIDSGKRGQSWCAFRQL